MCQAKHRKVTLCLSPPGLEAEIEAFVLDTKNSYPLGIEANLCTEHPWFSLQFYVKWTSPHSVNAKRTGQLTK